MVARWSDTPVVMVRFHALQLGFFLILLFLYLGYWQQLFYIAKSKLALDVGAEYPVSPIKLLRIAQLVLEHLTFNQDVESSNLSAEIKWYE